VRRDIDQLDLFQESREGGKVLAGPKQQRPYLAFQPARIVGDAASVLDLDPLRVAEIRREDEEDELALVQGALESLDPVVSPADRLDVEKAGDAVACQALVELPDEVLILAAMAQKNTISGI